MDTVPKDGTPVLVLLPAERPRGNRITSATYNTNRQGQVIGVVGNQFAFDMPEPIGWMLASDLYPEV